MRWHGWHRHGRDSLHTRKVDTQLEAAQQGVRTASPGQLVGLEGVGGALVLVAGEQRPQYQQLRHDAARRPGVHRAAGWDCAQQISHQAASRKIFRSHRRSCQQEC